MYFLSDPWWWQSKYVNPRRRLNETTCKSLGWLPILLVLFQSSDHTYIIPATVGYDDNDDDNNGDDDDDDDDGDELVTSAATTTVNTLNCVSGKVNLKNVGKVGLWEKVLTQNNKKIGTRIK